MGGLVGVGLGNAVGGLVGVGLGNGVGGLVGVGLGNGVGGLVGVGLGNGVGGLVGVGLGNGVGDGVGSESKRPEIIPALLPQLIVGAVTFNRHFMLCFALNVFVMILGMHAPLQVVWVPVISAFVAEQMQVASEHDGHEPVGFDCESAVCHALPS